jgi:alpha,alpha-trehalase
LPDKDYPNLFNDVQISGVFKDSKTFPDCIPIIAAKEVDSLYLSEKILPGFDLKDFVHTYFIKPARTFEFSSDSTVNIEEHIEYLWDYLTRTPRKSSGSLIGLPYSYVVPGGRFREIYYWDTYFTMLGLAKSGKVELIESLVNNFAFLIDAYGFIPNGNRTYYLSRSQPPFFSLMIDLLASLKGDEVYKKYLTQLESEYMFWMDGKDKLNDITKDYRRVVKLSDGYILNRYWDDHPAPRAEAYLEDIKLAQLSPEPDSIDYRNIRAACESGWDFSSRWLRDINNLESIETVNIIPVDLNSLLYHTEITLGKGFLLVNNKTKSKHYYNLAKVRKKAIKSYFWCKNSGFYTDYNWVKKEQKKPSHIAGLFPMFFNIADKNQSKKIKNYIVANFLYDGGIVTTFYHTGHQWDAPNGWAPMQYIAVQALLNYKMTDLAEVICKRWLLLNKNVYLQEGKLLEKYNVESISERGGGGEYPTQDGFGWTNGIYLYLKSLGFKNY